jgi:hypothetical protein
MALSALPHFFVGKLSITKDQQQDCERTFFGFERGVSLECLWLVGVFFVCGWLVCMTAS